MHILSYEHVGIRVSNRDAAVDFYEKLGFHERVYLREEQANEMVNDSGVMINLIFNGVSREKNRNVLMDEPLKYTGVTHPAFIVDNLDAMVCLCKQHNIKITEGPEDIGERRKAFFIRDPDGTVLEFDELY